MQQGSPIIVRVIPSPVESTTIVDVLVGAIGLTGVLVMAAVLLGLILGGILIGLKVWRTPRTFEAGAESGTIHIV
ncbi:MAG: hypothetical protein ABI818_13565 [Acidobacteriota bacterium]